MSSNLKANCYELATGCQKLYFSALACRKPNQVGKHCCRAKKVIPERLLSCDLKLGTRACTPTFFQIVRFKGNSQKKAWRIIMDVSLIF